MKLRIYDDPPLAVIQDRYVLRKFDKSKGFALVVTLSLMILLTVIAVGLLSLSAVTLRSSSQTSMQARASSNAKLALMLAIGELQKQLGPDQRVSANGAILSDAAVKHPHWAGVWDSWKAGTPPAGSTSPDAPSEHRTILDATNNGMNPTYVAQRSDHFRSWLVSLNPSQATDIFSARNLALTGSKAPAPADNAVQLVGPGSLGAASLATNHVQAGLVSIQSIAPAITDGRFGWWVGDESQKARILSDSYKLDTSPTLADRIYRSAAPASTGTSAVKELKDITNDGQLARIPSLRSLDLVTGVTGKASANFHSITPFSYQVLADVREGGLKRDLTTLLERPISITEKGDEFMLYRFGAPPEECVPIQDLAAYYQLYDYDGFPHARGRKEGVKYSANPSPSNGTNYPTLNGIQLGTPDFGDNTSAQATDTTLQNKYLREYTALYRRPVPIKIQMVLTMTAVERPPARITAASPDTHQLKLGFLPAITLWNPTNLPLAMHIGDIADNSVMLRFGNLPMNITWKKNGGAYTSQPVNLSWAAQGSSTAGTVGGKSFAFGVYFSSTREIVFKPGEVRVFSLPYAPGNFDFSKNSGETVKLPQEVAAGWDPSAFLQMNNSAPGANSKDIDSNCLTFKATDTISFEVRPETGSSAIENASAQNEMPGAGFQWFMIQKSLQSRTSTRWDYRDYQMISRYGAGSSVASFNASMITKGLSANANSLVGAPRTGSQIIARASSNSAWPFLQFAFMAGCETNELENGGAFAGRKFSSRPFLHSTAMSPSFIDDDSGNSLYNYGWNWWLEEVNTILEANIQVQAGRNGFYGGGYTPESGTTHVVQQEVPVVPPMSIAALSHAHLGGFSIANQSAGGGLNVTSDSFQNVTATGQGGLAPHTLQAIGNSYAHPNIPASKASSDWARQYSSTQSKTRAFADHSYLANKALWDDFFFSSISPSRAKVEVFGTSVDRTASSVAQEFFFPASPAAAVPLPNRRMVSYKDNLDPGKLTALLTKAGDYQGGLADKIAAHLMVEGPFNVNSTSIEAWRTLLSSLKGKKVAYLDRDTSLTAGVTLSESTPSGTPVGMATLPNDKPTAGSTTDPSEAEQWTSWRELSDTEITELATAMVKQVKLRGPFLSLSDFVNRRLDSGNISLSVKGALQAAIDDEAVSINSGFRNSARKLTSAENAKLNPAFREALDGPVAYGSAAYVDQADILRSFSEQLTPRGDTFVIRTYGDALNSNGTVAARAWCEAVVQRLPSYLDPVDEPHVKQSNLTSPANIAFGRKLRLVSFRWLSPDEV